MPETRTGPLVQKLVDGLQEDMEEAVGHLDRGLTMLRALEGETKGVNGLSAFLKAQAQQLDKMISDTREEAEAVAKKMLGTGKPEIVERVNQEKVAELHAAKEAVG